MHVNWMYTCMYDVQTKHYSMHDHAWLCACLFWNSLHIQFCSGLLLALPYSIFQYPTMLVISVLIVITGLAWPYRDVYSNILDLFLSVDVLLLLLLKNTSQFKDELDKVELKRDNVENGCVEYNLKPTRLSHVLLPFYYIPLLLSIVSVCVWIVVSIR